MRKIPQVYAAPMKGEEAEDRTGMQTFLQPPEIG